MRNYIKCQIEDRARYLRDTREHRMTIKQDNGLYRHITMRNPKSSAYGFNVTTFPGYLVFTGDMGSYTFSRLRDMFEFHRIDWDNCTPTIDYRYWASKADALDKHGGESDFDEISFRECAVRAFREHWFPETADKMEAWRDFRVNVIEPGHQDSQEATHAAMEWTFEDAGHPEVLFNGETYHPNRKTVRPFSDFYEWGPFTQPSFRLKWACWAIAETIRAYDLGGDRFARQGAHDALVLGRAA